MAKAKKGGFDANKIKDFLVAKGERAGLVVCLVIGVGLLILGIMNGMKNSTKDWSVDFKKGADSIESAIRTATASDIKDPPAIPPWPTHDQPLLINNAPWIPINENYKKNRRLPLAYPVLSISDPDKATRFSSTHGLTVVSENQDAQIDYLLAGLRTYNINFADKKFEGVLDGKDEKPKRNTEMLRPTRLIVVSMVYNLERQLKEHAEALGFANIKEMMEKNDKSLLPKIVGLDVIKYELAPGAKQPKETKIYEFNIETFDPKGVFEYVVQPKELDDLFRTSLYDTANPEQYTPHVFTGLMTPLPRLLTGPLDKRGRPHYPDLRLNGIKVNKDAVASAGGDEMIFGKGPAMPKPGGGQGGLLLPKGNGPKDDNNPGSADAGAPEGKAAFFPWKDMDNSYKELADRLDPNQGYFVFDPHGRFPHGDSGFDTPATPMPDGGKPATPKGMYGPKSGYGPKSPKGDPKGKGTTSDEGPDFERNRLIRFIDIDVKPGFTYAYSVQVYLQNPFWNRKDVDAQEWSKLTTLRKPSPPSYTPLIVIPGEYAYYAIDLPRDQLNSKAVFGNDHERMESDRVAVQIHRWFKSPQDLANIEHVVGDWMIAERLLVRRGDPIGKRQEFKMPGPKSPDLGDKSPFAVHVEFPEWEKRTPGFRIDGKTVYDKTKKPHWNTNLAVAFQAANRLPVLVDFEGGKRWGTSKSDDRKNLLQDSDYEMLVLDSDGKLIVRSSAADSVNEDRVARFNHWRTRILQARPKAGDGETPGPGPGGKLPFGKGG